MDGVPASHVSTLVALETALEAGEGVFGSPEDRPGIRVLVIGRS